MKNKVFENNIENVEKWQNRGLHKETDRNELAERGLKAAMEEAKQHQQL